MDDWQYLPIDQVAEIVGGGTPTTKDASNFCGDIPWITPKDLSGRTGRYISHGERNISRKGLQASSARLLPKDSVLLTTRAPVGYVTIAENPLTTNQGFRSLVLKKNNDPEFFYYLLKANTEYLKAHASGTTFCELSGSTLKSLKFKIPPLIEQRAIAHILGTLDDKLELNRTMNQTLEEMAKAIFKSWFVDFDPVRAKMEGCTTSLPQHIADLFPDHFEDSELGEVPAGWGVTSIRELYPTSRECVITGPFGSTLHAFDYRDEGTPLILVKHVNDGFINENNLPLVGQHKINELRRYRVKEGDIVFTRVGAVGRSALVFPNQAGWLISGQMLRVRIPDDGLQPIYLAQLYLTKQFIDMVEGHALGTTRPSLNTALLTDFKFLFAEPKLQKEFARLILPLKLRAQQNIRESRALCALRDTLLPKLVSGELRVRAIEKTLEKAL